jgi:hypothetical protein
MGKTKSNKKIGKWKNMIDKKNHIIMGMGILKTSITK